jgi:hypothetical protein
MGSASEGYLLATASMLKRLALDLMVANHGLTDATIDVP